MIDYNTKSKPMLPTSGPSLNPAEWPFDSITKAEEFFTSAGFKSSDIYAGTEINVKDSTGRITKYRREIDVNNIGRWRNVEQIAASVAPSISGSEHCFIIEATEWSITEGYINPAADGSYTEAQYETMYKNGKGFTDAIYYAQTHGYTKVVFPHGTFCFCPTTSKTGDYHFWAIIWVRDANNLDIDLNGSELHLLVDSKNHSPYNNAFKTMASFYTKAALFLLSACNNVSIHNGTLVGDRKLRKWLTQGDLREMDLEFTYGVQVSSYSHWTSIYDMDISYFMGDAVVVLSACSMNEYHSGKVFSTELNRTFPNYLKSRGFHFESDDKGVVSKVDDDATSITAITDMVTMENGSSTTAYSQIYTTGLQFENVLKLKKERKYCIYTGGGAKRTIDLAENFQLLTYSQDAGDVEEDIPLRVIDGQHFMNFQLAPDEYKVAIQVAEDTSGSTYQKKNNGVIVSSIDNARSIDCCFNGYQQDNTEVHHCYIHDNHRGGITGFRGTVKIHHCRFYKHGHLDGLPAFTVQGTNYHINNEDACCYRLIVSDCEFERTADYVGKMFFLRAQNLVFCNNRCDAPLRIEKTMRSDVYGNVLTNNAGLGLTEWMTADSSMNNNSSSDLIRVISFHDNYITGLRHAVQTDVDIYRTKVLYFHNYIRTTLEFVPRCKISNISTCGPAYARGMLIKDNVIDIVGNYVLERNNPEYILGTWEGNTISFENVSDGTPCFYAGLDSSNKIVSGNVVMMANPMRVGVKDTTVYNGAFINSGITISEDATYTYKNCIFSKSNSGNNIANNANVKVVFENCKFTAPLSKNVAGFLSGTGNMYMEFVSCDFSELTSEEKYLFAAPSLTKAKYGFRDCVGTDGVMLGNTTATRKAIAVESVAEGLPEFPTNGAICKVGNSVYVYINDWIQI